MIRVSVISKTVCFAIAALVLFAALACGHSTDAQESPAASPAAASPTPEVSSETITIAAVGDIMLGSTYPNESRMPPEDGAKLLAPVTPILSAADIAFGNLEGPMADSGASTKCRPNSTRCFAFRVPTHYGKYLKDAGFDVLSLANNHAGDFGDSGRESTRKTLDALDIKHAGSDRHTYSTTYLTVKGKKVAFIGFAHNAITPNVNDLDEAERLVRAAKKKADIVVVSFHGGAEGTDRQHVPNATEIFAGEKRGNLPAFAHRVIDAGAALVLGHGPHVMRGMELYKGHLVVYSLGNFATYGWFSLAAETALSEIVEVKLAPDGKFIEGKITALKQEGRGGPVLDPTNRSIEVVRSLSQADFGQNAPKIADDGKIALK
ncbi:MAG: CapA family protein [Acidobacteria bacterium ACB1]|nr:Capsule biosynthesis protein CapA [Pyrinomonadaceae bacterium]MCE7961036.1 CapA family protein [Acidobacteria bacterium ACB1]RIJ94073.1 MAG: capsule biosynthesis protein CapA [Acidobacteriota bacterium]